MTLSNVAIDTRRKRLHHTWKPLSLHTDEKHLIERTQAGEFQAFNPLVVK